MADPIESFLALHGQSDPLHIPQHQRRSVCCCGSDSCAYLKHNQNALDGLERDVSTAARLGKALLARHEAYITDSERERKAMSSQIDLLETEKQALERKNAMVIEENRGLLDQLEGLNNALIESDAQVTNLQQTLQATQQEIHKLTILTARTERLEQQLADFEREQATWHASMEAKDQSERSAVRRWKDAERTIASLEEQIERIEHEAKEEMDRHTEIVGRMERRHSVEQELRSAAGRLKGAAALKSGESEGPGTTVVSHFVKDILQDNANLQMGIVELREMLNNSNEEVESLRQQLSVHKPADDAEETVSGTVARKDLDAEMSRANSQELHVHHHYHAAPTPAPAPKPPPLRKTKKKRYGGFGSGHFTPPSGASTPRSSFSYGTPTSTATILKQTAASVPQPIAAGKRWSTQSNQTYQSFAPSSGPSSPQSTTNRTSSIFDRVFSDAGHESSRPTTPGSEDPGSPVIAPLHSKRGSGSWGRTHSAPIVSRQGVSSSVAMPSLSSIQSVEELPKLEQHSSSSQAIQEETEDDVVWDDDLSPNTQEEPGVTSPLSEEFTDPPDETDFYPQPLRRATSHESLLSVSGMDIHTLRNRPSQLLAPYAGRTVTSQAVISDATAHASRPAVISRMSTQSRNLLTDMAAERQPQKQTLGKKVGGWVFGKWGATPAPTVATAGVSPTTATKVASPTKTANAATARKPASIASASSDKKPADIPGVPKVRSPGINQSGPIAGFFPELKTPPSEPVIRTLDQEALSALLGGH